MKPCERTRSSAPNDPALALELAMNGVDPSSDWVFANTRKAQSMFGNQGVKPGAMWLAALHPRALEYLEQAPVLALAATYGGRVSRPSERAYAANKFKPMIERGERLKDVMKAFRVAYPLRSISATAIRPGVWCVLQTITRLVDPSTISQSIPESPTRHMHWLGNLRILWTVLQRRAPDEQLNAPILRWAMLALSRHGRPPDPMQLYQIADFLICNRAQWNARWTWKRMNRETAAWHEALANAQIDRINDGNYDKVVPYRGFPTEVTLSGFEFHALRSLRALIVEGKAMHHCVASYYPDIQSGRSRIYSIRKDGRRVATAEFAVLPSLVHAVQIKGVCNARPPKDVIDAADTFARCVTEAGTNKPAALRGLPRATREAFTAARAQGARLSRLLEKTA